MTKIFSQNLKKFRVEKNMTQEQAGKALGVSAQTISRWECNTTLPDVAILPEIARLYGVTIDDLYRENAVAYEHYASRLFSIYESSSKPEDFLAAEQEYRRMVEENHYTMEDLRSYGILHQYMMLDCKEKALSMFDRVLKQGPKTDAETYWRTKRQKILFWAQIGKAEDSVNEQLQAVSADSTEVNNWICLLAALNSAGKYQEAESWLEKAIRRFTENACLCVYGGDICRKLKKYEKAIAYWDRAILLDDSYCDAMYSKGFCYEELGEYDKAYEIWCQIIEWLEKRGYLYEIEFPRQLAQKCREKMQS